MGAAAAPFRRVRPFHPSTRPHAPGELKVRVERVLGSSLLSSRVYAYDTEGREWLLQDVHIENWETPKALQPDGTCVASEPAYARLIAFGALVEELIQEPASAPEQPAA